MKPLTVVQHKGEQFFLRFAIFIIPSVYLFHAVVQYFYTFQFPLALQNYGRILTEIALLVALYFANDLFLQLPNLINQLFLGNVLSSHQDDYFDRFIHRFNYQLNHRFGRAIAWLMPIALLLLYIKSLNNPLQTLVTSAGFSLIYIDQILYGLPALVYAYFAGLVAWRMWVISCTIYQIPRQFSVHPKLGHPDQAGGLLPLGRICLKMIYVAVIPTIFSALVILSSYFNLVALNFSIRNYILAYVLLLFGAMGSMLGLAPVFRMHEAMVRQNTEAANVLHQISQKIIELNYELSQSLQTVNKQAAEEISGRIAACEAFYQKYQSVNTWPINPDILVKIWASQTFLVGQIVALWNLASALRK